MIADVDGLSRPLHLWRCFSHWLGGMGIVLLGVAILPLLGQGGNALYRAEFSGAASDRMRPRIVETARALWLLYVLFTLAEMLLLKLAGMNTFEAVCHAFSTLGTGGFSTRTASIAGFNSPLIEYIVILFMFLAGVSFIQHYRFWIEHKPAAVFRDYYGAQTSSDLGVSALGKGGDSFDYYVSVMNGEGYTKPTDGAGYALMGRVEWHAAGAHVGLFGHSETDRNGVDGYDPTRAEIYAWWENDAFMIGGQYLTADDGDAATKFKDGTAYNVLTNIKVPALGKKTTVFLRYDSMDEKDTGDDHTLTIAGIEFEAAKGVMFAVDYQSDDKGTTGSKSLDTIGVHSQFKF